MLDGSSLIRAVENPEGADAGTFFWRINSFAGPQKAVRSGRWKYMVDRDTQLLFDLEADIGERRDVFGEHPAVVRELRVALAEWERSVATGVPQ